MIEKLYTVEEVAELASVTGRTIRNYLKSGRLVGRKIGGQWRFPESEVQRLLTGGDPQLEETPAEPAQAHPVYEEEPAVQVVREPAVQSTAPPAAQPVVQPTAPTAPPVQAAQAPVYAAPVQQPVPQPTQKQPEQNLFAGFPQGQIPQQAPTQMAQVQQNQPQAVPTQAAQPVYAPQKYPVQAVPAQSQIPGQPQGQPVYPPQQGRTPREYLVYNAPAPLPSSAPPLSSEAAPEEAYAPYAYGTPYPHAPSAEPPVGGSPKADGYTYSQAYPQGGYEPSPTYQAPQGGIAPQPGGMAPPSVEPVSQSSVPVPKTGAEVSRPQAADGQVPPPSVPPPAQEESPLQAELPLQNEPVEGSAAPQSDAGLPQLSDVGLKVVQFVAEVHDCSEAPQTCTVLETVQPLEMAKLCIEQLTALAAEESAAGLPCECYVEYDERFAIARYTLLGTSRFLARCLQLVG